MNLSISLYSEFLLYINKHKSKLLSQPGINHAFQLCRRPCWGYTKWNHKKASFQMIHKSSSKIYHCINLCRTWCTLIYFYVYEHLFWTLFNDQYNLLFNDYINWGFNCIMWTIMGYNFGENIQNDKLIERLDEL